jgi:hypothetical protein
VRISLEKKEDVAVTNAGLRCNCETEVKEEQKEEVKVGE